MWAYSAASAVLLCHSRRSAWCMINSSTLRKTAFVWGQESSCMLGGRFPHFFCCQSCRHNHQINIIYPPLDFCTYAATPPPLFHSNNGFPSHPLDGADTNKQPTYSEGDVKHFDISGTVLLGKSFFFLYQTQSLLWVVFCRLGQVCPLYSLHPREWQRLLSLQLVLYSETRLSLYSLLLQCNKNMTNYVISSLMWHKGILAPPEDNRVAHFVVWL